MLLLLLLLLLLQGTYYASLLDKTIMQLVESNRQKKRDGGATVEGKENIISGEGGEDGKSLRKRSSKPGYVMSSFHTSK